MNKIALASVYCFRQSEYGVDGYNIDYRSSITMTLSVTVMIYIAWYTLKSSSSYVISLVCYLGHL